jgi:hypothetical protein
MNNSRLTSFGVCNIENREISSALRGLTWKESRGKWIMQPPPGAKASWVLRIREASRSLSRSVHPTKNKFETLTGKPSGNMAFTATLDYNESTVMLQQYHKGTLSLNSKGMQHSWAFKCQRLELVHSVRDERSICAPVYWQQNTSKQSIKRIYWPTRIAGG